MFFAAVDVFVVVVVVAVRLILMTFHANFVEAVEDYLSLVAMEPLHYFVYAGKIKLKINLKKNVNKWLKQASRVNKATKRS